MQRVQSSDYTAMLPLISTKSSPATSTFRPACLKAVIPLPCKCSNGCLIPTTTRDTRACPVSQVHISHSNSPPLIQQKKIQGLEKIMTAIKIQNQKATELVKAQDGVKTSWAIQVLTYPSHTQEWRNHQTKEGLSEKVPELPMKLGSETQIGEQINYLYKWRDCRIITKPVCWLQIEVGRSTLSMFSSSFNSLQFCWFEPLAIEEPLSHNMWAMGYNTPRICMWCS